MAKTTRMLPHGLPSENDYRVLLDSAEFRDMEAFSDRFLSSNQSALVGGVNRWGKDPLHQWSRQWEYPFVFSRLQTVSGGHRGTVILDAGSGVTFFPYYIRERFESAELQCCDSDARLKNVFEKINSRCARRVEFFQADIRCIPCEDSSYDAVYCISVLEHTDRFEEIIGEFHRIIRPGGRLIVTFDVSLDGTRDISPSRGTRLIEALLEKFGSDERVDGSLSSQAAMPGIFTTVSASRMNGHLLPWTYPAILYRLKSLLSGKGFCPWPPVLTVCCLDLTKPPA
jgi:SAM-dependent methyltransferase